MSRDNITDSQFIMITIQQGRISLVCFLRDAILFRLGKDFLFWRNDYASMYTDGKPYLGMYAVRDEDDLASFQTKATVAGTREFAVKILEHRRNS